VKRNLVLLCVGIVVALVMAEAMTRLLYEPPTKEMSGFPLSESSYYRRDEELGFVPRPNVEGVHRQKGSFAATFSTNSLGLRDREHTYAKREDVTRAVVLGDSFAWGWGVNDDEVFTSVLEAAVGDLEVINLGVKAYTLPQEILYFWRRGVSLPLT
jgi:hypothetical protein